MTDLSGWTARQPPDGRVLTGRLVRLERLGPDRHGASLGAHLSGPGTADLYAYLADPVPAGAADVVAWAQRVAPLTDPFFYAVVDVVTGHAVGRLSLMRIDPANGVIEVGHVLYAPSLQRSPHATEVQYLLARHVFEDLGYRRYEWKCNAQNAPSRRAALRLGFNFEGVFRQHMVVKGANRDTAWFSMLDGEWPARCVAFERWLSPDNFDREGRQKASLNALRRVAP
jgi:RimJ/RimL family protein N-acetyltransferase